MAERRMISRAIIDSDAFLDMPASSQNLYFHLNIRADDEGFIDGPKKIMRTIGANQNDLEILLSKRYLLAFDSGVIVIKHWRLHNLIRKDRAKETLYKDEKQSLYSKEDGSYTDHPPIDCQPSDNQVTTKCPHSIEEYSIVEDSTEKEKDKKESRDFSAEWETLKKHWNNKSLPEYRKMLGHLSDYGQMLNNMTNFSVDEMAKAIDNYVDCLPLMKKGEPKYNTFYGFMRSGVERFFDGANPFERYGKPQGEIIIDDEVEF